VGDFGWPPGLIAFDLFPQHSDDKEVRKFLNQNSLGHRLVFIYIGSSSCGFANPESIGGSIKNALAAVAYLAKSRQLIFASIGISLDPVRTNGVGHLRGIAPFEMNFPGGRGTNLGMKKIASELYGASTTTPQILVVLIRNAPDALVGEQKGEIVFRAVGESEISSWVKRGFNVPSRSL